MQRVFLCVHEWIPFNLYFIIIEQKKKKIYNCDVFARFHYAWVWKVNDWPKILRLRSNLTNQWKYEKKCKRHFDHLTYQIINQHNNVKIISKKKNNSVVEYTPTIISVQKKNYPTIKTEIIWENFKEWTSVSQ